MQLMFMGMGTLGKAFYEKDGKEALPIIAEVSRKGGEEYGKMMQQMVPSRDMKGVAEDLKTMRVKCGLKLIIDDDKNGSISENECGIVMFGLLDPEGSIRYQFSIWKVSRMWLNSASAWSCVNKSDATCISQARSPWKKHTILDITGKLSAVDSLAEAVQENIATCPSISPIIREYRCRTSKSLKILSARLSRSSRIKTAPACAGSTGQA
jgi:hypothetical protein